MAQFSGSSELNIDVEIDEGVLSINGVDLEDNIIKMLGGKKALSQIAEMTVYFDYEGYYDKGRLYGPPEDCYPADFDEERFITSFVIGDLDFDESSMHFDTIVSVLELWIAINECEIDYEEEF